MRIAAVAVTAAALVACNAGEARHKPVPPDGFPAEYRHTSKQDHGLNKSLDQTKLIPLAKAALESGEKVSADLPIKNTNRTVGATLSGEIAKRYGYKGLPEDTIKLKFNGSAGQLERWCRS